jgi:hypothetical protein
MVKSVALAFIIKKFFQPENGDIRSRGMVSICHTKIPHISETVIAVLTAVITFIFSSHKSYQHEIILTCVGLLRDKTRFRIG